MKIGGKVGTKVQLIVSEFPKNLLCDDVIMTLFLFFAFLQREGILWQNEIYYYHLTHLESIA